MRGVSGVTDNARKRRRRSGEEEKKRLIAVSDKKISGGFILISSNQYKLKRIVEIKGTENKIVPPRLLSLKIN